MNIINLKFIQKVRNDEGMNVCWFMYVIYLIVNKFKYVSVRYWQLINTHGSDRR